jgi:signal peptidase II
MLVKNFLRTIIIVTVLVSNISCDQITKGLARKHLSYHKEVEVVNQYLTLTKIENDGAFLSVGSTLPKPVKLLLLVILPIGALAFGLLWVLTNRELSNTIVVAVCFIVGGGVGNLYDRIAYGSVTDFLYMDLVIFQTGIFNMADVSIMTGIGLLMFEVMFRRDRYLLR